MFPKKSYGFETQDELGENLNVSILGLPPENDWIRYAPYSDKSLLRNVFTFTLGKCLGFYCSATVFCELIINDEYQGIYVLMEKIKQDDNRVNIARLEANDISGDDLTGGYIFKVDKKDWDFPEGISGWKSSPVPSYPGAMDITYQYYDPKPANLTTEQRSYLKDAVTRAEANLISPDFDSPDIGYNSFLNTGSFVDFMIINEISKEVDKYRYSSYFYKKKDSKGGEIFAGPIWDFNLGYGNVDYWEEGLRTNGWLYDDVYEHEWSIIFWWKRLMEDPFFEDLMTTRWEYLREHEFSDDNIQNIIDSLVSRSFEAKDRNYEKWPVLGTYIWPNYDWQNNDYSDEVNFFSNWLFNRLRWMDMNVQGQILNPTADISSFESPEFINTSSLRHYKLTLFDEYFEHNQPRPDDFSFQSGSSSLLINNIHYLNASEAIITLSGSSGQITEGTEFALSINEEILTGFRNIETSNIFVGKNDHFSDMLRVQAYNADGNIYLRCNRSSGLSESLSVYSITGRLTETYQLERIPVNIIPSDLPKGIYILKFYCENKPYTAKIIISQ